MGIAWWNGKANVGDSSAPDFSIAINVETGTIEKKIQGTMVLAGGTTTVIPVGGMTDIKFVWLKGKDSNDDPRYFNPVINSVSGPDTTEYLSCSYNGSSNTTTVSVVTQAGVTTYVDYVMGGD